MEDFQNIKSSILQSYFAVPRPNLTDSFVMKIPNKIQQIAFDHYSGIDVKDVINLYKKGTAKPYSFWLLILLFHQIILYILERIF